VAHNAGAMWAMAPTILDFMGQPPVGSILPYSGSGDPPETGWVIADGRLIDKTAYAEFFKRTGHIYNNGIDPGSNKVKIPDKRGRHSIGQINMGSPAGAGANDNGHAQAGYGQALGLSYGEVSHALQTAEAAAHNHTLTDPGHNHGISDGGHAHNYLEPSNSVAGNPPSPVGGHSHQIAPASGWLAESGAGVPGPLQVDRGAPGFWAAINNSSGAWGGMNQSYNTPTGITLQASATGITINGHATGITLAGTPGASGHNNLAPFEADSYIVRIA
jgi:microcystin-dependent protein